MSKYHHLTEDQINEIVASFEQTRHVLTTAKNLGIAVGKARHWLRKRGLVGRNLGTGMFRISACQRNSELVLKMAKENASLSEIGRAVGTNDQRVRQWLAKHGIVLKYNPHKFGADNHHWKGGRRIDDDGYVLIYCPEHPFASSLGTVREHRLVMERTLSRYLTPEEVVHHKNKDKADNRPENLELFSKNSEHLKSELTGQIPKWTDHGKQRIREAVVASNRRRKQTRLPSTPDVRLLL